MPIHDKFSLYGPVAADQQLKYWQELIKAVARKKDYAKIDFGKTEKYLTKISSLPVGADGGTLVPKYETVELGGYNDWLRQVGKKVMNYDDRHMYCRGVRWFNRLIAADKLMAGSRVRDHFFGDPHSDDVLKMTPEEMEKTLYKVLSLRNGKTPRDGRTKSALETMFRNQPGPFVFCPYSIEEKVAEACPRKVLARLPDNQFALPLYVVLCWILMRLKMENIDGQKNFDVLTNEDRFRVDCLGDNHIGKGDDGTRFEENAISIRWAAKCLKLDTLPIDKTDDLRLAIGYTMPPTA